LYSVSNGGKPRAILSDVVDFCIDTEARILYVATNADIRMLDTDGRVLSIVCKGINFKQVLLCAGIVHGCQAQPGSNTDIVFRIVSGSVEEFIRSENIQVFAFYRTKFYYISNGSLFCADTNGTNAILLDVGPVASFSFVGNEIYIASSVGGGKNRSIVIE
jgi:hypothetical protein